MEPAASPRAPSPLPALEPAAGNAPLLTLSGLADLEFGVDVPLGRAALSIRDLLELRVGSVLALDRLTGEHLEILVNGTPVAKGEIRVHGERFAVRITEVLKNKMLQGSEGKETDEKPETKGP